MWRWLALALAMVLGACAPHKASSPPVQETSPSPTVSPAFARASVSHMFQALSAVASHCEEAADQFSDKGDEERADALIEGCKLHLLPAHNAVRGLIVQIVPWTPKSAEALGCTASVVRHSFNGMRVTFKMFSVPEPALLEDGLTVAEWAERFAPRECQAERSAPKVRVSPDTKSGRGAAPNEW